LLGGRRPAQGAERDRFVGPRGTGSPIMHLWTI
jgi:hypothetical protein